MHYRGKKSVRVFKMEGRLSSLIAHATWEGDAENDHQNIPQKRKLIDTDATCAPAADTSRRKRTKISYGNEIERRIAQMIRGVMMGKLEDRLANIQRGHAALESLPLINGDNYNSVQESNRTTTSCYLSRIDSLLFSTANTIDEYADESTLDDRLRALLRCLLRRRIAAAELVAEKSS